MHAPPANLPLTPPCPGERLAVIIPLYNHGGSVRRVVEDSLRLGWPVFVVDDGSNDGGPQGLADLPGCTLLSHPHNQGKGAALLTGLAAAARVADWAITLDADGQHQPGQARNLLAAIVPGSRPLVLGCRLGMEDEAVPWTSRWGRRFSNFWVWAACGRWLSDSQSGFRLYPLPEVLELPVGSRRFQYEVEVLVRAVWAGLGVRQAPVAVFYPPRGQRISHFQPGRDFWRNAATFSRLIGLRLSHPGRWLPREPRP